MNLQFLETKQASVLSSLNARIALVEKEARTLTEAEQTQHTAELKEAEALGRQILKAKQDADAMAAIDQALTGGGTRRSDLVVARVGRGKSLGEQILASAVGEYLTATRGARPRSWQSPAVTIEAATLLEDGLPEPDRMNIIVPSSTRPLVMAELFAQGTTDSNATPYMQETGFTNAAAAVAEGAAKPESTLTFALVSEPVRKIAHWLPVSDEMLEDVPAMRSYIDARLRLGVSLELDEQLLTGTTTPPDIVGILNRSGLAPSIAKGAAPETNADVVLKQIAAIYTATGLAPDGIVLHPTNYTSMIGAKATDGSYLGGGPFQAPGARTIWGLTPAVSTAMPVNTALIGAFKSAAMLLWRQGITVDVSNAHADFFIRNLTALRAEVRVSLNVFRPSAFGTVTALT